MIGLTQFIRPIGQISKWWNAIGCWLWGGIFINSGLTLHSVQSGHVFCELKIYARMAWNHMECMRQHLAIYLCWYAVRNYIFLYKSERKPKEWLSVLCNSMVRRLCFPWEYSQESEEVSLVQMQSVTSHVVTILYYMNGLSQLEMKCFSKRTYGAIQRSTIDSPNKYSHNYYTWSLNEFLSSWQEVNFLL